LYSQRAVLGVVIPPIVICPPDITQVSPSGQPSMAIAQSSPHSFVGGVIVPPRPPPVLTVMQVGVTVPEPGFMQSLSIMHEDVQ
jgi:hypothetical protein